MTLRARLAAALFVLLVGPVLGGMSVLTGALPAHAAAAGTEDHLARSAAAVRRAVAVRCVHLANTARALAAAAGVRGDRLAVTPAATPGPWRSCASNLSADAVAEPLVAPGPVAPGLGTPGLGTPGLDASGVVASGVVTSGVGVPATLAVSGAAVQTRYAGIAASATIRDRRGVPTGYAYAVQPLDVGFLRELSLVAGARVTLLAGGVAAEAHHAGSAVVDGTTVPLAVLAPVAGARPVLPMRGALVAAVALTAVVVAGWSSWWLAGTVTRPLLVLVSAVQRVANGDLSVRSRLAGPDETGRLGRGLDHLISAMQETVRLSVTDPLTGLGNVRQLEDCLHREVERASRFGHMLGVLVLDLDRFKAVNDTFGHRAGDDVLVELAVRVRGLVREVDLAFRQGGEEFVILLPETDLSGSLIAAQRIGAAVRGEPFQVHGRSGTGDSSAPCRRITVTVSIGIAVYPYHACTGRQVLDAADEALYAAKGAGRDTCALASALPSARWRRGDAVPARTGDGGARTQDGGARTQDGGAGTEDGDGC